MYLLNCVENGNKQHIKTQLAKCCKMRGLRCSTDVLVWRYLSWSGVLGPPSAVPFALCYYMVVEVSPGSYPLNATPSIVFALWELEIKRR